MAARAGRSDRATGSAANPTYDEIGAGYASTRRPDPRIAARIDDALAGCESVVNVGAGTGSYEPRNRRVLAVEPAATMIRQRPAGAPPAVRAAAEQLPLRDRSSDAALAVLTVHHWRDRDRGLAEMRRIARRRVVVLTWEQDVCERFWLVREYFPCIGEIDRPRALPPSRVADVLGGGRIVPVPVPHDCIDGFLGAFWRRPAAYLDPRIRAGISSFAVMSPADRDRGLRHLEADLADGTWHRRHADLLDRDALDVGYRLVIA